MNIAELETELDVFNNVRQQVKELKEESIETKKKMVAFLSLGAVCCTLAFVGIAYAAVNSQTSSQLPVFTVSGFLAVATIFSVYKFISHTLKDEQIREELSENQHELIELKRELKSKDVYVSNNGDTASKYGKEENKLRIQTLRQRDQPIIIRKNSRV